MDPQIQNLLPQHALSRFAGLLANCEIPWIKNYLIRYFINRYIVNMAEAQETDPFAYPSFNAFFTRALKPNARPIASGLYDFISPVDGTISQVGAISNGKIIQAKHHHYSVKELLGGNQELAESFKEGSFITVYLAPHQYHRVHMPIDGYLSQMIYIPGRLFSVNPYTTNKTENLFARNERVVSLFNTSSGRAAVIMVGAMIVGSIETSWTGTVNRKQNDIQEWHYAQPIYLKRGEEMGRFKLGSTVIVLLEKESIQWNLGLSSQEEVLLGQSLGQIRIKNI